MESTYFNKIKTQIVMDCGSVNDYADRKDVNRNHVNYGRVTAWSLMMCEIGHKVEVFAWEDNGFLRISALKIDGQTIIEHQNGK